MNGKRASAFFNLVAPGLYEIETDANGLNVTKLGKFKPDSSAIKIAPPERQRVKPILYANNNTLKGTPARIFTQTPGAALIERGAGFWALPYCSRVFILLHEKAHQLYKTEKYCDAWALKKFIEMGYNYSSALMALTRVLKESEENKTRIFELFNQLKKNV
jgi:hypothetical protein